MNRLETDETVALAFRVFKTFSAENFSCERWVLSAKNRRENHLKSMTSNTSIV